MRYAQARYAAVLFGIGLGGFLDGIVLHQIAHWHQMLSAVVPPESVDAMKRNMVADGWFHMATWLITFAALLLLLRAAAQTGPWPATRTFLGYMLIGWGGFNLAEGVVNHHVLELHHVRDLPAHVPAYDWLFLLIGGVGLILAGLALRWRQAGPSAASAWRRAP